VAGVPEKIGFERGMKEKGDLIAIFIGHYKCRELFINFLKS
jgi:hypothetical protein